jgi:hypothetical protein
MLVNTRSASAAGKCCKGCTSDYGSGSNGAAKKALRRQVKRRERNALRRELKAY